MNSRCLKNHLLKIKWFSRVFQELWHFADAKVHLSQNALMACTPNSIQSSTGVNSVDKAEGVWAIADSLPMLLEDFDGLKHTLVATTSNAEALELHMLAEAKCHPDWALWEKAINICNYLLYVCCITCRQYHLLPTPSLACTVSHTTCHLHYLLHHPFLPLSAIVMDCHTSCWLSVDFWWTDDSSTYWFDWLKDWFTYD